MIIMNNLKKTLKKNMMDKKISTEDVEEPLTERQRGFMEASENWLKGLVIFGWICVILYIILIKTSVS